MTTPDWGSPESAAWFRAKLDGLGMSQSALARLMLARGDDRQKATILRSLSRMASGEGRVSGEMRALLGTLEEFSRQVRLNGMEGCVRQPCSVSV